MNAKDSKNTCACGGCGCGSNDDVNMSNETVNVSSSTKKVEQKNEA